MRYWKNPDGSICSVPDVEPNPRETIRQFLREAGKRGGLERSRRFAARSERCRQRFERMYGADPNRVKPAPVRASDATRDGLKEFASRGGQARTRKYTREQRSAWAAKGGYTIAAKRRAASSSEECVAGKHERIESGT